VPWITKLNYLWSTFLQGGQASKNSFVKTSENLFSESKIQTRGSLAPCGLSFPRRLSKTSKPKNYTTITH